MSFPVSNVRALVVFLLAAGVAAGLVDRGAARTHSPAFAVGLRVFHFVDHTRTIRLPGGRREARPLVTYVRYPALGAATGNDLLDAPTARSAGPFPLVVFGHGYRVTPATYARLLRAWTHLHIIWRPSWQRVFILWQMG